MKKEQQSSPGFIRYLILFLTCIALYGNMFIFDQPALLKEQIMNTYSPIYGDHSTSFYFSFLYSFYSIPNIVLPLVGGFMSDIFGYRKMSLIFMIFVVLGQGIVYFGSSVNNLKYMIFGRFTFGLGGESLGIATSIIINKWFVGKELSFANALNLSLIRSATVLGTILSPRIAETKGMTTAFGVGFVVTILSGGALILMNTIDSYVEKVQKKDILDDEDKSNIINFQELLKQILEDVSTFPRIFWILTLIMTTFYTSLLIFISFSSGIIIDLWLPTDVTIEQNQEVAGELMVHLLDQQQIKQDKEQNLWQLDVYQYLLDYYLFYYFIQYSVCQYQDLHMHYLLVQFGLVQHMLQNKNNQGTAFGVMNSVQNFAFFLMPLFIAFISAEASSQVSVVLFFLILACISLIIAIYLYIEDRQRQISLNVCDQKQLMDYINQKQVNEDYEEEEQIIEQN